MGGLSQRALIIVSLVLLTLQDLVIADSLPLALPLQSPLIISEKKFVLRKCCAPGFIYNFNTAEVIPDEDRCVKFSVSSSHPQSRQIPWLLLGSKQNFPSSYGVQDVRIDAGFPRNCTPDEYGIVLDFLDPDKYIVDLFYVLSSGHLIVPHRFQFFEFDSYCIEDHTEDGNFKMATRKAIFCSSQTQHFPATAVDDFGQLNLDFMKFDDDGETFASKFRGRRVIRKCCSINQSLNSLSLTYNGWPRCRPNEGLVTPFFHQLNRTSDKELFFHFHQVKCDYPTRTTQFRLNSNGSLQIQDQLIPFERYCLDDMVEFDDNSFLPFTSIYAFYCPEEEPEYTTDGSELMTDPPLTESPFTDPPVFEIESTAEPSSALTPANIVPKCCPAGHVMHELEHKFECRPMWWWPSVEYWDEPNSDTDPAVIVSKSLSHDFQAFRNISNTVFVPNTNLSSCKAGQLQQGFRISDHKSPITPLFRIDSKNQVSLTLHTFVDNYWDVESEIRPFCVDKLLVKEDESVFYVSSIFHCIVLLPFQSYRPVIFLISIVALLVTFAIYFFVPAPGAAKLVIKVKGKKNGVMENVTKTKTMAMVLTGRILLCHIISLSLAFSCLAIVQLNVIPSAVNSCIAIGYITYWALIASFSWLTVYCFDYYRIFRGSFKVSNDRLFIPYSAFGWGVPILAMLTTIIAQFQSTVMGVSGAFNPNIGVDRCWFPRSSLAETVFLYGPIGVLLSIDIFFFVSLMFNANLMHCWQNQQGALRSNRKLSSSSKEHDDFKMAMKLFFITGVPWIFEFIAYVYELKYGFYTQLRYFHEFSQLLNTSRGVFIFVNFIVLNRDVRKFLWPRMKRVFSRKIFSKSGDDDDNEDTANTHHTTNSEDVTHSTSNGSSASQFVSPSPESISSASINVDNSNQIQSDEHSYL